MAVKTVRPSNGLKRVQGGREREWGGRQGRRTGGLNRQVGSEGRGQKMCYSRIPVLCCKLFFLFLISAGDCAALTLHQLLRDTLHKVVGAPLLTSSTSLTHAHARNHVSAVPFKKRELHGRVHCHSAEKQRPPHVGKQLIMA